MSSSKFERYLAFFNKVGEIIDISPRGNFYTVEFKNGDKAYFHESDLRQKKY